MFDWIIGRDQLIVVASKPVDAPVPDVSVHLIEVKSIEWIETDGRRPIDL